MGDCPERRGRSREVEDISLANEDDLGTTIELASSDDVVLLAAAADVDPHTALELWKVDDETFSSERFAFDARAFEVAHRGLLSPRQPRVLVGGIR